MVMVGWLLVSRIKTWQSIELFVLRTSFMVTTVQGTALWYSMVGYEVPVPHFGRYCTYSTSRSKAGLPSRASYLDLDQSYLSRSKDSDKISYLSAYGPCPSSFCCPLPPLLLPKKKIKKNCQCMHTIYCATTLTTACPSCVRELNSLLYEGHGGVCGRSGYDFYKLGWVGAGAILSDAAPRPRRACTYKMERGKGRMRERPWI
jgi:hypothetical protein